MSRQRGDRKDGKRIRDIDPFHAFMSHLMPNRTDSEVYMHAEMDVTALLAYIDEKNKNLGDSRYKTTLFHTVVAATAKVIHARPKLNRFISGRRYYQRNEISLSFVAKKQFTDHAEEAIMILRPTGDYTIGDYTKKIVGEVIDAREGKEEYGADGILNTLAKMPLFVNRFVMAVLRFLDNRGRLPKDFVDVDPNQTTVLLSNLGSIKCDAVYHHLNNFGTNSIVVTIGEIKSRPQLKPDGTVEDKRILPVGITIDERIADGFYFARSIKIIEHVLANPHLLDEPLAKEFEYSV